MTFTRTLGFLLRTPLVRQPSAGPVTVELTSFSSSSTGTAVRPRAYSRTISSTSIHPSHAGPASSYSSSRIGAIRGYASDKGKQELYSDEAGSTGAGTDDVAHTGAAYDKNTNPHSEAKGVEEESGKEFTNKSAANEDYSKTFETGSQRKPKGEKKMEESR